MNDNGMIKNIGNHAIDAAVSRIDALKSRLFGINPELARNLIREVTATRLFTLPAIIAAVLVLVYLLENGKVTDAFMAAAIFMYVMLGLFGTAAAGNSVLEEFGSRTWDFQRMTAIGPWAMTWGKYAGATAVSWYGGLIVMAAYFAALLWPDVTDKWKYFQTGIILIAGGAFMYAFALLTALASAREAGHKAKSTATATMTLAFLGVMPLLGIIPAVYTEHTDYRWYYFGISPFLLVTGSMVYFTGWLLAGAYRTMRAELQYSNGLRVWAAFLLSLLVYASGFVSDSAPVRLSAVEYVFRASSLFIMVCAALLYITAFVEPSGVIEYGRVLKAFRRRDRAGFLNEMPLWAITFCAALASLVVMWACVAALAPGYVALSQQHQASIVERPLDMALFGSAFLMFMLRDILLLTLFRFSEQPRYIRVSFFTALTALYLVVPKILDAAGAGGMTILFWPPLQYGAAIKISSITPTFAALCEAAAVFYLVRRRYRRLMSAAGAASGAVSAAAR